MATLTMATPLAPSSDVKNTVANDLVRDDCKECDDYYNKCRGVSNFPSCNFAHLISRAAID
jgi:hypothetical protein